MEKFFITILLIITTYLVKFSQWAVSLTTKIVEEINEKSTVDLYDMVGVVIQNDAFHSNLRTATAAYNEAQIARKERFNNLLKIPFERRQMIAMPDGTLAQLDLDEQGWCRIAIGTSPPYTTNSPVVASATLIKIARKIAKENKNGNA